MATLIGAQQRPSITTSQFPMELRIFVDEVTYSREADQLSMPSSIETGGG